MLVLTSVMHRQNSDCVGLLRSAITTSLQQNFTAEWFIRLVDLDMKQTENNRQMPSGLRLLVA